MGGGGGKMSWHVLPLGSEGIAVLLAPLPRAGQNPCQRREMTVFTTNGLHDCMGRCTTCFMPFFTLGSSKSKFPKFILFFNIVIT